MKSNIGIWIDHQKAIVVNASETEDEPQVILSNTNQHLSRVDGVRSNEPFEAQQVLADDVQERRFSAGLNRYYKEVSACIGDAEAVFIFGPGEARGQLKKCLEQAKPALKNIMVEVAQRMTNRQITAHVREHFIKTSLVTHL